MTVDLPLDCAFVCNASCHEKAGRSRQSLVDGLADSGLTVIDSPCMGVCDGLVAAVPVGTRIEIVRGADKAKTRRRTLSAVATGRRSKVARHSITGSGRRRAIAKLSRKLADVLLPA